MRKISLTIGVFMFFLCGAILCASAAQDKNNTDSSSKIFEPLSGFQVTNDIVIVAMLGPNIVADPELNSRQVADISVLSPQNVQKQIADILKQEMPADIRKISKIILNEPGEDWPVQDSKSTLVLRVNYAVHTDDNTNIITVAFSAIPAFPLFKKGDVRKWYKVSRFSYPSVFSLNKNSKDLEADLNRELKVPVGRIAKSMCLDEDKNVTQASCRKDNE